MGIKDIKAKSEKKKSDSKSKTKGPEFTDTVNVEFEPSDRDEFISMSEGFFSKLNSDTLDEETLEEVLSIAGRMRRRQQVRRYKAKMQIARRRSLKRRATNATIKRRARRSAINSYKKRFAGGRSADTLTYSERARVEKLVARRKGAINRKARRLIIKKRQEDRMRLQNASHRFK